MNGLSNRVFLWIFAGVIGGLVVVVLLLQHAQDIAHAWVWLRWLVAACGVLLALYALYMAYHQMHMRALDRAYRRAEMNVLLSPAKLERERLAVERLRLQLEHDRVMLQNARLIVPAGHTAIMPDGQPYSVVPGLAKQVEQPVTLQGSIEAPGVVSRSVPDAFDLVDVFRRGRVDKDNIFIGKTADKELWVPASKLCHGALNAVSGRGKTITVRGIEAQILHAGFRVIHLDPKFCTIDESGNDYRPIEQALMAQSTLPGTSLRYLATEIEDIARVAEWLACVELPRRQKNYRIGNHAENDLLFVFLDEWLYLADLVDNLNEHIKQCLVIGRSLGVRFFACAQNFQAQCTDLPGGVADNFETAYYPGGDDFSGARILKIQRKELPALTAGATLGQGLALVRNASVQPEPRLTRIGMASNDAVYALLGNPGCGTTRQVSGTAIYSRFAPSGDGAGPSPDLSPAEQTTPAQELHTGPLVIVPQTPLQALDKTVPSTKSAAPDTCFMPGPNDLMFTPEQTEEFLIRYNKKPRAIKEILREMNSGKGLSNRFCKYAKFAIDNLNNRSSDK